MVGSRNYYFQIYPLLNTTACSCSWVLCWFQSKSCCDLIEFLHLNVIEATNTIDVLIEYLYKYVLHSKPLDLQGQGWVLTDELSIRLEHLFFLPHRQLLVHTLPLDRHGHKRFPVLYRQAPEHKHATGSADQSSTSRRERSAVKSAIDSSRSNNIITCVFVDDLCFTARMRRWAIDFRIRAGQSIVLNSLYNFPQYSVYYLTLRNITR